MLLPCGVACAASLWILDLAQIWTGELMQRLIMSVGCFTIISDLKNVFEVIAIVRPRLD